MQTKFLREVLQDRDGVHPSEEGLSGSQHNTELTGSPDKYLSIIAQKILSLGQMISQVSQSLT